MPTNLVAQRGDKPLSATLQTVTIMRASATDPTPPGKLADLIGIRNEACGVYGKILARLPEKITKAMVQSAGAGQPSRLESALSDLVGPLPSDLQNKIDDIKTAAAGWTKDFSNRIADREKSIVYDGLKLRLSKLVADVTKEYAAILDELAKGSPTGQELESLKSKVLTAIKTVFQSSADTIFVVPISSGLLQSVVKQFIDAVTALQTQYKKRIESLQGDITSLSQRLDQDRGALRSMIDQADADVRAMLNLAVMFRPNLPEAWIPVPDQIRTKIGDAIGEIRLKYDEGISRLASAASSKQISELIGLIDQLCSLMPPPGDNTTTLGKEVTRLSSLIDAKMRESLKQPILSWLKTESCEVDDPFCIIQAKVNASTGVDQLKATYADLAEAFSAKKVSSRLDLVKNAFDASYNTIKANLESEFEKGFNLPVKSFETSLSNVGSEISKAMALAAAAKDDVAADAAVREALSQVQDSLASQADRLLESSYNSLYKDVLQDRPPIFQAPNPALLLVRAFGPPPVVPNLGFDRPQVAYFYSEAQRYVDITPVIAFVNQAGQGADALKALGVNLPTRQLLNDLVPQPLQNFNLRSVFPDFSGLKLDNLFPGLKLPDIANGLIHVSHGVDAQTRQAWVQAVVNDITIANPGALFALGPIELSIPNAHFTASTRFETRVGQPPKRQVSATIRGDWQIAIGGTPMVIFEQTELIYDDASGLRFNVDPKKIKLAGILTFVSELLAQFGGQDSGLSFGMLPDGGIQSVLSLPVPDIQLGAFGISNLHLGALLALRLKDPNFNKFSIELGFNVGRKSAPFALTIFILGGGGYIEVSSRYVPELGKLTCDVSLGITASASLAIALGPIHGGVYVYFGVTAEFHIGGGSSLAIGVMLLIRGEVSILGIVSASISLLLEAQYDNGRLVGRGRLTISIKICWCFTLNVDEEVSYTVGAGGGPSGLGPATTNRNLIAANFGGPSEERPDSPFFLFPDSDDQYYRDLVEAYTTLLA